MQASMQEREAAIRGAWQDARDLALRERDLGLGGGCLHPDCGPVCIPPEPVFTTRWCRDCKAMTRQVSAHDPFGVHVLDRCLACDGVD